MIGSGLLMQTRATFLALCAALSGQLAQGANLTHSTITEVVKDVSILSPSSKSRKSARLQETFSTPDVMRTGPDSRAEMIAEDQTVTRVGANTVFSFVPEKREINLERGSVLFNAPSGKGGGTIKTAAATAAVLGTTLIVVTTKDGGFKVLLVEGTGKVTSNGQSRILNAGQMTFVLPGQPLGPILNFQLKEQVGSAKLIRGFKRSLPSSLKIEKAIAKQEDQIKKGTLQKTGLLASDSPEFAYQVQSNSREVLVEEKHARNEPTVTDPVERFLFALGTDAVISEALLDEERLFTSSALGSQAPDTAQESILFAARNVSVVTQRIDLTEFQTGFFELIAAGDLDIGGPLQIRTGARTALNITVGGTITNAPRTLVTLDNRLTRISAFGSTLATPEALDFKPGTGERPKPLKLSHFALYNPGGAVELFSPAMSLSNAGFSAGTDLTIAALGNISLENGITALPAWRSAPQGTLLFSTDGSLIGGGTSPVPDTSFSKRGTGLEARGLLQVKTAGAVSAYNVDFVAARTEIHGSRVSLKKVRFSNSNFDSTHSSVQLRALGLLEVSGARFQARDVSMQARTIVLNNLSFDQNSRVILDSQKGKLAPNPNTGAIPVGGMVNFFKQVNYGTSPAQNYVNPSSGTKGIFIK